MFGLRHRFLSLVIALALVFAIGTAGYVVIEGWPVMDAFYMTAITLTTVGFGEVNQLSNTGRLFTVGLLLLGVGSAAYGLGTLGEYFLTAGLAEELPRRRMLRRIEKMENHVIICGFGRVGQSAAHALQESNCDFVIVDTESVNLEQAQAQGWLFIQGDATRDETLKQAGILRANGVIICTGSDADNLMIVLSARVLNPNVYIVARTIEAENEAKMRRAGADKVISPYRIGGRHMANVMMRPNVTDFLDVVMLDGGIELWLEELTIEAGSPLAGRNVVEADIRRRTGVILVALLHAGKQTALAPDETTHLVAGDTLIVLGNREQLDKLERMVAGEK
jgi:voltage-gated potassium channel